MLNRTCLVLGGGREAEEKTDRLLDAGARVVLLATELTPALAEWANTKRICHYTRPFTESDLDEVFLVVNTLADEPELTQRRGTGQCAQHTRQLVRSTCPMHLRHGRSGRCGAFATQHKHQQHEPVAGQSLTPEF